MICYLRVQRMLDLYCRDTVDAVDNTKSKKTTSARPKPAYPSQLQQHSTISQCTGLAVVLAAFLLFSTSGHAQQTNDGTVAQDVGAGSQSGDNPLPQVDVTTENPDAADPDAAPQKETVAQDTFDPAPKKKKRKATQTSAPSTANQATVFAEDEDFDEDVEPAELTKRSGEAVRGSLGTGTTDVDGYVAGASSTFTKTNNRIQDVPHSVSIVTKEQIEDQGHQSLGQALEYVPGVTVQQGEGHRDQITIRGQETNADFFTDGVRDDIQYYRDLYNIEAVEVLKGPAALVFGRGGSGGIVNRVTKKAEWRDIREATINFGMFDRKRTTIDVGGAATNDFAFRLNAMYEDSESFRDFFELERYGINPTIAVKLAHQRPCSEPVTNIDLMIAPLIAAYPHWQQPMLQSKDSKTLTLAILMPASPLLKVMWRRQRWNTSSTLDYNSASTFRTTTTINSTRISCLGHKLMQQETL